MLYLYHNVSASAYIGGSLRGKGWKYGSGFVDGIFPVLSPTAQQILRFVQREVDSNTIWDAFDSLPPTHATWDDLINVSVQLRLNKKWDPIVLVRNSKILLYYYLFYLHKLKICVCIWWIPMMGVCICWWCMCTKNSKRGPSILRTKSMVSYHHLFDFKSNFQYIDCQQV